MISSKIDKADQENTHEKLRSELDDRRLYDYSYRQLCCAKLLTFPFCCCRTNDKKAKMDRHKLHTS
jgi:hypothetical protein